jgi:hypothetical protein
MAVNLSPLGGAGAQFFSNNGVPLAGGLLYTYLAGTSTPATAYTSSNGITALSNPIILDAAGRVPTGEIWLTDGISYKFVLKDATDALIATWDNLSGINSNFIAYTAQEETATATAGQTVFNTTITYIPGTNNLAVFVNGSNQIVSVNYTETDENTVTFLTGLNVGDVVKFSTASPVATNATSAANVSYTPAGASAVVTNVQAKLRETVSVKDFGAVGDGTTNDTTAFQNAVAAHQGNIYVPKGTYLINGTVVISSNQSLVLDKNAVINYSATSGAIFTMAKKSSLIGNSAYINLTSTSWAGEAITIDGAEQVDFQNTIVIDGITFTASSVTLGTPTAGTTGLYAFANGDNDYVSGMRVANVTYKNFEKAIVLEAVAGSSSFGDPTTWRWVNGNTFDNCFVYNCTYAFKLLGNAGPPNAVDGNIFSNFIVQAFDSTVEEVAEIQGNDNRFYGYVWDFPQGTKQSFNFAAGTSKNVVSTNMTITAMTGEDADNFVCRDNNTFNNVFAVSSSACEIAASNTNNSQSMAIAVNAANSFIQTTGTGNAIVKLNGTNYGTFNPGGYFRWGLDATAGPTFGDIRVASIADGVVSFTTGATNVGSCFNANRNTAGSLVYFTVASGATYVGAITTNLTTTTYATASDYRLKDDVKPMVNALATVEKLNPVTYTWKSTKEEGQGFIAHEMQAVIPEAVTGVKDGVDESGAPVYQGVDTSFLIATLTAAVQELSAKVKALEAK